jgi:hypothetical protein
MDEASSMIYIFLMGRTNLRQNVKYDNFNFTDIKSIYNLQSHI